MMGWGFAFAKGQRIGRTGAALTLLAVLSGIAGCAAPQTRGYILNESALEQVPVGSSQEQVMVVLGTPSTVATIDGEVFYYISTKTDQSLTYMRPSVSDQRVLAVYFDKSRKVERIANYGMQDGKIFDFISRTTPTSGQELSYLTPLFKLISFN